MNVLLLGLAAVLLVSLVELITERKRNKARMALLNRKIDALFKELQAAEKAAQLLADYDYEC